MIKYFVRTTLDRKLDETYNQIDYQLLVDTEHKPVESFIKQLDFISNYDAVLLEDDLILCKDFKNRIEDVIKQYPDKIINFFYSPNCWFRTKEHTNFAFNQCTYYPKGVAKLISKEMLNIDRRCQYDVLENLALKKLNISHIIYRPCLVQHLDTNSLIGNHCNIRFTEYFIDYLDELNMNYIDAKDKVNRIKLKELMMKHLKEYS